MSLHFPCLTTYHSNFFVLRLDIRLNREPVKLNLCSDGLLELCGQPPKSTSTPGSTGLPMTSVARDVYECLKKHGHDVTNRVMYGDDAPLFQVTVQSLFSLKKLIAKLPQVDKELETALKAMLSGSAVEGQDVDCEVTTQLYLVCPDAAKKDACIIPVEEENFIMCIDLWKASALFEFGDVFKTMKMNSKIKTPCSSAPVKVTLAALVEELVEVVDWFHLGLYLEVPEHELKEIRCDYPDVKQRKTQALSVWMKMKEASWSQIVRALVAIRMKTLARHIATKYGVPLPSLKEEDKLDTFNSDLPIVVEKENKLQLKLVSTIKELGNEIATQDNKLALKEEQLSALKSEWETVRKRGASTRARAMLVRDEAKKLEKEQKQLQREAKRMETEIRALKEMQNLYVQNVNKSNQEKEELQDIIAEKESELRAAYDKLEEKERELRECKREVERVGRRLEEVDREVGERNGRIRELERERAELRADLQSERRRVDMLLEKATSCSNPQTDKHRDDSVDAEIKIQREEIFSLTQSVAEKEKEVTALSQKISDIQKQQVRDKVDLDVLSLQLQLSELREMMAKKEREREEVGTRLIISTKVAQKLEKLPAEMKNISKEFPKQPPPQLPAPELAQTQETSVETPPQGTIASLHETIRDISIARGVQRLSSSLAQSPAAVVPEFSTLVFDNGSGLFKAGFAGRNHPHCVFPSLVGRPDLHAHEGLRDHYVGDEAQNKRDILSLKYPIECGVVTDWEGMEKIWSHTFYNELQVKPEENAVVLCESGVSPSAHKKQMAEIMFETFNTTGIFIAPQNALQFATVCHKNRLTGLVLGLGFGVSSALPIYCLNSLPHACVQLHLAGRDLTDHMANLLQNKGFLFSTSDKGTTVRDIKEKMCHVSLDFHEEITNAKRATNSKSYTLPNGQIISLDTECFMCPEALFQPSLVGLDSPGIHHICYDSIMKCDKDLHTDLFANIMLAGGSSLFPGLAARMKKELTALAPSENVNVTVAEHGIESTWVGGSIAASSNWFLQNVITKWEYEESGPSIIRYKCIL